MRLKAVAFLAAALLVAVAAPSQASTGDLRIVYPDISSKLAAGPFSLVFSGDGKMGFALAFDQCFLSARLFSFGLVEQNVIDVVDLVPDFGVGASLQTAPVITLALQDTLLAFETSSGQIADEVSIASSPDTSIQLLEPPGLVAYSNNTDVLSFVSVSTAPSVTSVQVDKRSMTIIGRIFLEGAHVLVNGESVGTARRDAADPSHQITIDRGKKDFPSGSTITVTVVNRDGATSSPFPVTL